MSRLLAIDPGYTESAWCVVDLDTCRPVAFGKYPNEEVLGIVVGIYREVPLHIEMIASYGMPVGAEVFDTCVWIGRFLQARHDRNRPMATLTFRKPIKLHHCGSTKATDANIKRALIDRFAYGQPNYGKGTKAAPGWFYGFAKDVWQAYALAVYAADTLGTPGLQVTVTPITGEQP